MNWRLQAWRNLWRDARAGELRLLLIAVVLGLAGLSAVAFLADRIQAGLQRDAAQLLGGDVVVVSDQPTPEALQQRARDEGLRGVITLSFPTMARTDAQEPQLPRTRLVALKAVQPGYPLRGTLQTGVQRASDDRWQAQPTRDLPAPGEAWVDAALLDALGLQLGDPLWLGDSRLRLSRVLVREPDRGAGFMNFAPRVMIHDADLAATGLVQPASRITWRYALVGAPDAVARYAAWAEAYSQRDAVRGVRVETLEAGRPEMRQTLDRASQFLRLVALLAALLSAVAVALAARSFAARHLDECALLRVFGVSQRDMAWMYAAEFVLIGTVASALGLLLGYGLHALLVLGLAGLIETELPAPGWTPVWLGGGVGMTLLLAFGLPPVLQLARVPALRVMRREIGGLRAGSVSVWLLGVSGFVVLLLAASRDLRLGGLVLGGFAGGLLVFAALTWLAVAVLRRVVREEVAPTGLLLATRQIASRPLLAVVQVSTLAMGLLALFLLTLLRTDLVDSWRQATPTQAPNRFVINIQPWQAQAFQAHLQAQGVASYDWFPMVRGRLVAINGRSITPGQYQEERAQRLVDREFNLSYTTRWPEHNQLLSGRWSVGDAHSLSLEEGIARTLGIQLGDVLRFDMAGVLHEARVTSLRQVDWTSLRANFFVLFPVDELASVPMTYLAAFRVGAGTRTDETRPSAPSAAGASLAAFDNALLARFPNVTSVDLTATLDQVQSVLTQVIRAVELLFVFTLATGWVVVLTSIRTVREARAREYAVLRALGATERLLWRVQTAELLGVGALAGALASVLTLALGWALAHRVFEFDWQPAGWMPLAGIGVGALLAWLAGWWGLRGVLQRPVVQTLREARV